MSLIIVINFILQSTIVPHFAVFGIVPNTSLVIVIIVSILTGKRIGSITGLIIGMLQDIMFSSVIGVNSFIYFFIGYLIGIAEAKLYKDSILLPFIMSIASTFAYHLSYYIFMFFLNYDISFINFIKDVVFIETIYNTVLSVLLYKWFIKLFSSPSIRFIRK